MTIPELPLGLLGAGEQGEIVPACRTGRALSCRPEEMGLRPGRVVQVLVNSGGGPVLLEVDGSRLALGRRMAMKNLVRRQR